MLHFFKSLPIQHFWLSFILFHWEFSENRRLSVRIRNLICDLACERGLWNCEKVNKYSEPFEWALFWIFVTFLVHMFEFLNLPFHFSPSKCFYFFIKNFFEVLIDVIILRKIFSLVIQKLSSRQKLHFGDTRSRIEVLQTRTGLIRKVFLNLSRNVFICVLLSGTFS